MPDFAWNISIDTSNRGLHCNSSTTSASVSMKISPDLRSVQLIALLQNTVMNEDLTESTFEAWYTLATVLKPIDFVPYLAVTSAIFVKTWPSLSHQAKNVAKRTLSYILSDERHFGAHIGTMASFKGIDDLRDIHRSLVDLLPLLSLSQRLEALCSRILDMNAVVSLLAVKETTTLVSDPAKFHPLISGDTFDPSIGHLIKALQAIAGREGESYESTRLAAFQCLGVIGAVDPDRFEIPRDHEDPLITFSNLNDEKSAQTLAIHIICNSLAPIFPKTSDVKFQSQLAYTIQELLGFCKFTDALVTPHNQSVISVKVRNRWKEIPDDIQATIAPLLSSKFTIEGSPDVPTLLPIYSSVLTYKDWIQRFTSYLISRTPGIFARPLFSPFRALLTAADVQVLLFIMPHIVMDILLGGVTNEIDNIRKEIISVLEDQVTSHSMHSADMKILCAQVSTLTQSFTEIIKSYIDYLHIDGSS
jgi:serine/threonine-protein kinase ATR